MPKGAYCTAGFMLLLVSLTYFLIQHDLQPAQGPNYERGTQADSGQSVGDRTRLGRKGHLQKQQGQQDNTESGPKWTDYAQAFSAMAVAFLTYAILKIYGRQTKIMAVQARIQNRSLKATIVASEAAREAAKAADLSAKAAIGVELPSLHIEEVKTNMDFPDDESEISTWLKKIIPVITIKNYGRSPAFVNSIIVNVAVARRLPKPTKYSETYRFHERVVIPADKPHVHYEYWHYNHDTITDADVATFMEDDQWLHIYGVINFLDFLDVPHKRGFSFFWSPESKTFLTINEPEYNYQK